MTIDESLFRNILLELVDENPIACGGVLGIAEVCFTTEVPTLAVTLEDPPVLKVNLAFLREEAKTEEDIKAVLLHEFLHVILNHTEQYQEMPPRLNLALDAVINHIIHRLCGPEFSRFFRHYYKDAQGWSLLLVPLTPTEHGESRHGNRSLNALRCGLLEGKILVDDVLEVMKELARHLPGHNPLPAGRHFVGGHTPRPPVESVPEAVRKAIERTLRSMNGHGIFRSPKTLGYAAASYAAAFRGRNEKLERWERTAWQVLREFVTPDSRSTFREEIERGSLLPILNTSDRRAFLRSRWNPLVQDVLWKTAEQRPLGTCQVYLDVSGSMNAEMAALVGLLNRLKRCIRSPFWAFSTEVKPAVIENGILRAETSGGTAMNCVLAHARDTRPGRAVVITDGYIESCNRKLLRQLKHARQELFALVSRDGSTQQLDRAGIPCCQLEPYPEEK